MNPSHLIKAAQDQVLGVAWRLPHDTRRALYRKVAAGSFNQFQEDRQAPADQDYGLRPFDDKEAIFVHIPKCAGISVSRSLFGSLTGTHVAIKTFQLIYSKEEFDRYYKFSIVRNPWDRLHSAYRFLKQGGMTDDDRQWAEENLSSFDSFESFVTGWVSQENVASWQHFKPQHRFVVDPAGTLQLDFVGRFETLAADFKTIADRLGVDASLPHHNRTAGSSSDYRSDYTDKTRRIVGEVYRKDVELFGYEFDSFRPI